MKKSTAYILLVSILLIFLCVCLIILFVLKDTGYFDDPILEKISTINYGALQWDSQGENILYVERNVVHISKYLTNTNYSLIFYNILGEKRKEILTNVDYSEIRTLIWSPNGERFIHYSSSNKNNYVIKYSHNR